MCWIQWQSPANPLGTVSAATDKAARNVNPHSAMVIYLNFRPLEFVSPQPRAVENYSYLFNLNQTFTNLAV